MSRYSKTRLVARDLLPRNKKVVEVYGTTIYQRVPETNGDLHIITTEGDRLDNLANRFYGNANLWWYIAKTNGIATLNVPAGTSLTIPSSVTYAVGG